MSFRRQHVCALTGIPVPRFKTLLMREQLPVATPGSMAELDVWGDYSAFDVLAIAIAERLMCQMGYADGLPPGSAQQIVSNSIGLLDHNFIASKPRADQWIGYAAFADRDGGFNVGGSLTDILEQVRSNPDNPPARMFLVNASEALRDVKARAKQSGIPFPSAAR